ncbi:TolC family protein [Fimbriimonas ginsengisoli]|uniref:Outer membrane efflux protein n=1 Tax=Fimbriimonas ginsengisoli Gsoil 348 TaxID=661478 RepID=A0A068NRW5_FIMGI|nr:TolC family protein [Fimbriimonas ginsengisoli]AIE86057.1 outer membrane efflux protein [Fimbriimonas ginsengisoli Gsoil 348]
MKPYAVLAITALGGSVLAQEPKLPLPSPTRPLLESPNADELAKILGGRDMTIEDAVGIALATSRGYATSIANLERAKGRTGEARAALQPQAGVGGSLTIYDKPNVANFGPTSVTLQNQFNSIYTASISLPIDLSGAIHAAASQAQFSEVAARIDVNRVRNQLVSDVKAAFYQALRAQGQFVVSQDTLTNAQTRLEDAQATLRAGTGTQFDVLTAQRDVADAQQAVVNARGAVTLALARLKNVMGVDVSAPIRITDTGAVQEPEGVAPVVPPVSTPPLSELKIPPPADNSSRLHTAQNEVELGPDYQAAVREALATRPEVLESEAALTAAQRGVMYERRRALPTFSLSAQYVVQPTAAGFTPEQQGSIGLNFNIPIFRGGLDRARVREAEATVAGAKTDRRSAIDQVTFEVQQAYVNLAQARERVQVANVGLAQAREAFRLARLRARVGVSAGPLTSPQLELSNAQASLTQAETNRVNALYDYNQARSDLDRAVGRYSYGPGSGYAQPPTSKDTGQTGKQ